MRKRQRFIVSSFILAGGLVTTQLLSVDLRFVAIVLFCIATYFISAWALYRDLDGVEWFTTVPMPAYYALSVSLFYFLLPSNIFSKILIILLFGVGMYALYLTSNIYSVGKVKTIQLLRAANATSLAFLLLTTLFLYNFIFSLHLPVYLNAILIGISTFLPSLSAVWGLLRPKTFTRSVLLIPALFTCVLTEVAIALSFLPVGLWQASLFLTSILYVGFGIFEGHVEGKLFLNTLREYLFLALFVTISFFLLMNWK